MVLYLEIDACLTPASARFGYWGEGEQQPVLNEIIGTKCKYSTYLIFRTVLT